MASAKGGRRAVVAILGADSYLAEQSFERVLSARLGEARAEAVQVLRGDETSWARVAEELLTGSLFVTQRAVVVRAVDALKGDGEELQSFLADPTPGVTLVLLAAKPDRRRTIWKRISEHGEIVSAEPLKGRALRARVVDEVRQRGLLLGEDAVEELLERVGADLRRLMGEIDKLDAYGAREQRLTADDVAAVLGRGLARPLYRVSDAFLARRAGEVLELIEEVLDDGEAALRVLATLHRALRQVRGARALREARAPRDEVMRRLGVLPFKVDDVLSASRLWSDREITLALASLGRADRRLKTGVDPRAVLVGAVVEACGKGRAVASTARAR